MTNEEWTLCAYAAAAAGIPIWRGAGDGPWLLVKSQPHVQWNPLTNDGDALGLLAKLNIDVRFDATPNGPIVECRHEWTDKLVVVSEAWDKAEGVTVAVRRAIVRVAAALGAGLDGRGAGEL